MEIDTNQLLTQSQVAKQKGMTLQLLAHHLAKGDAPQPVIMFGRKLYRREEVKNWKPTIHKGRKTTCQTTP